MNNDNGNKKEAPIIAICPICKKRFRDEDGTNHIITRLMIATPAGQEQLMTFPLILCPTCGIYFHPFEVLDALKKRLQGEGSRIIQAPANVKLVK
jgi:hypothetical protein